VYCIDASVLVAIFDESDIFHRISLELFESIVQTDTKILIPAFALVEVAGALSRKGHHYDNVIEYLYRLRSHRNIEFLAMTTELYELAADIAIQLKVKGADSIYIAVSYHYNLKLVTYDNEQRDRGGKIVATATPEECSI
jgi:predicted nucleic acid-binding protein